MNRFLEKVKGREKLENEGNKNIKFNCLIIFFIKTVA